MLRTDFCLWCRETKRLVLNKLICYICEAKSPRVVQLEQKTKQQELWNAMGEINRKFLRIKEKINALIDTISNSR